MRCDASVRATRLQAVVKPSLWLLAGGFTLGCMLVALPARAGDDMNRSEVSTLVVSAGASMLVSAPLFVVANAANAVSEASTQADGKRKAQRVSAGPLPDMQVKAITETAEGGRTVALQDPTNPDYSAQLHWPQREDNPAANFSVGQTVAFTASPKGAGWMLRADDGAVLTFVPTIEAAGDSRSRVF